MKLQVHGEERDGGWENLAGNQNTSVHGTGIFLRVAQTVDIGFHWGPA